MEPEAATDLLIPALDLYRRVVADPMSSGADAVAMVARARDTLGEGGRGAEALVAALRAQAWFEHARLANGAAKSLLDEAARIARSHRADERLSEVLITRAAVNMERGSHWAARRDLDAALEAAGGEPPAEAGLAQAGLFFNTGRLDAAAVLCRRVLADRTASVDLRAKAANNLAMIEAGRGRPAEALVRLDEADELATGLDALGAAFCSTRAWVLAGAGRLTESLQRFEEAERRFLDAGLPTGELLMEQLDALVDLRLIPEARRLAVRAVREFTEPDVALMAADARLRLAQVDLLAGASGQALEQAALAAAALREQRRPGPRARAQTVAVAAALRLDDVGPTELA
uniref:hypothetical protein n=1 Tax=Pseudonocardia lacus TaxID=2835865 RepID=UPI001BDC5384